MGFMRRGITNVNSSRFAKKIQQIKHAYKRVEERNNKSGTKYFIADKLNSESVAA